MKPTPIGVRLSMNEKAQLQMFANHEGLSLSDAVRELLRKNLSLQVVIQSLDRLENEIGAISEHNDPTPVLEGIAATLNGMRNDILHLQRTYLNSVYNRLCLTEMMKQLGKLESINSQFEKFKSSRGMHG